MFILIAIRIVAIATSIQKINVNTLIIWKYTYLPSKTVLQEIYKSCKYSSGRAYIYLKQLFIPHPLWESFKSSTPPICDLIWEKTPSTHKTARRTFHHHTIGCIHWLTIQASIDAESCFHCGLLSDVHER